jgi:hypothetical protein
MLISTLKYLKELTIPLQRSISGNNMTEDQFGTCEPNVTVYAVNVQDSILGRGEILQENLQIVP